jgi:hypothetical protein
MKDVPSSSQYKLIKDEVMKHEKQHEYPYVIINISLLYIIMDEQEQY